MIDISTKLVIINTKNPRKKIIYATDASNSILVNEQGYVLISLPMYCQWLKAVRGHVRLKGAHESIDRQIILEYLVI